MSWLVKCIITKELTTLFFLFILSVVILVMALLG